MGRLVWILLIVSVAVGLSLLLQFNHGNVAVLWPPYRVDVSVNVALLGLIVLFVALHLLVLALGKALNLPARVREYRLRRRQDASRKALRDGLLALFEGRFGRAERLADKARDDQEMAGTAALVAARAAHRMREVERRDRWLERAREDRRSEQAELTTAAEFALDEQDASTAVAAIERLHAGRSRHIHSLRLALRAYELGGNWARLLQTLRLLEKRDALPDTVIRGYRVRACRALFERESGDDPTGVRERWRSLRSADRAMPEVVAAAAAAFARAGDPDYARKLIEDAMKSAYSPLLVRRYAALDDSATRERIERAEHWLEKYGPDPALLLALGRLCMRESLWGKAKEFLQRHLAGGESAAAHVALAELAEATGQVTAAATHYRAAARLGAPHEG
ncbi:MAG TPA: heme biosynthesis HemY N-terminal domain-containing protein [Burkholderiaceae bacterium]